MLADPAMHWQFAGRRAGRRLFEPQFWAARGELITGGRAEAAVPSWLSRPGPAIVGAASLSARRFHGADFAGSLHLGRRGTSACVCRVAPAGALGAARLAGAGTDRGALSARRHDAIAAILIMRRIADAEPLSSMLAAGRVERERMARDRRDHRALARAGVDHADLNAHNILLDGRGAVSIIDFDRGACSRPPAPGASRNLRRLHRSLHEDFARDCPPVDSRPTAWESLLAGYDPMA